MTPRAIHQFHYASAYGDGITNGMLFTQKILRQAGYRSEIYCAHIDPLLAHRLHPLQAYEDHPDDLLLVHYSLGHDLHRWIEDLKAPRILVYHNITPAELLPKDSDVRRDAEKGREQLARWARSNVFRGTIADSDFNGAELIALGYPSVTTIPLLVDLERIRTQAWNRDLPLALTKTRNLVFVGRFTPFKGQLDLVRMMKELVAISNVPVRLILAGGATSSEYQNAILTEITEAGLAGAVTILGKCDDEDIYALYRTADIYVSLSQHEGFGMPLVEAMVFDVPVLAYAAAAVPSTLGTGGLLLDTRAPDQVAAAAKLLLEEPVLRRKVLEGQRRMLPRYERSTLTKSLESYLRRLGFDVMFPTLPGETPVAPPEWRIEGPFDSSYSLAIVNRGLARGLATEGESVGLVSRDGPGPFDPDVAFLEQNPDLKAMWKAGQTDGVPEICLRDQYPPDVSDQRGLIRAISCYGWEESGFPADYVRDINANLDVVTVLSRYVAKVLRDNGVHRPIRVVGGGIDHVISEAGEAPVSLAALEQDLGTGLGSGFRFLHVSSAFPRKGIDALLSAWGQAFSRQDNVVLVIKTFPNPHNTVEDEIAAFRKLHPDHAPVILINKDLRPDIMRDLYRICDAVVGPSRGEGFGLPFAEAMALGKPVITTGFGGQTDFCTPQTSWLCEYRFAYAQTHFGVFNSVWVEPDVASLAACLREVYNASPEERARRTDAARARVLSRYRWQEVAKLTRQTIDEVRTLGLTSLRPPKIAWVSTWNSRCGIATYSEALAGTLPPERLVVLANTNADSHAADQSFVRRCWHQGWDDPLDNLYDEICSSGADAAVIQFNFGFFRLDALSHLIERLTADGIAVYVTLHSTADVERPEITIRLSDARPALSLAKRVFVHSVHDLNRLMQIGIVDNATLFPHGLPAAFAGNRDGLRQKLGLEGRKIIASFGFLLPHKGLRELIRAAAILRERDENIHLLMLNALYPAPESQEELKACQREIEALGMQEHTTLLTSFIGQSDILAHLASADVVVFPYQSTQESASGAIRLGLSSLTPVACTPLSIFGDVTDVTESLPGISPEDIAVGLGSLLNNPKRLAELSGKQRLISQSHSWAALSRRLDGIIRGNHLETFLPQSFFQGADERSSLVGTSVMV